MRPEADFALASCIYTLKPALALALYHFKQSRGAQKLVPGRLGRNFATPSSPRQGPEWRALYPSFITLYPIRLKK